MSELDEKVAAVRRRIEQARTAEAAAQREHDVAAGAAQQAAQQLEEEFGVTSVEEAKALLATLNTQVSDECERVMALLKVAERAER